MVLIMETKTISHGIENIDFNIFVSGNYKFLYYDSSNIYYLNLKNYMLMLNLFIFIKPSFSQLSTSSDYTLM